MKRKSGGGVKRVDKHVDKRVRVISATLRAIDIWTAILLLTGQITVAGVFVASGGIWFTLAGPVLGNVRFEGKTPNADLVLDAIDVITAFLLILGQITNTGPWISSGRFNMVVSGPAFGITNVPVPIGSSETSETARGFFSDFCQEIINREMSKIHR